MQLLHCPNYLASDNTTSISFMYKQNNKEPKMLPIIVMSLPILFPLVFISVSLILVFLTAFSSIPTMIIIIPPFSARPSIRITVRTIAFSIRCVSFSPHVTNVSIIFSILLVPIILTIISHIRVNGALRREIRVVLDPSRVVLLRERNIRRRNASLRLRTARIATAMIRRTRVLSFRLLLLKSRR